MPRIEIKLRQTTRTVAGYTCTARRLWLPVSLEQRNHGRVSRLALIDTGAPMCVIPHEIHVNENLKWQPVSDEHSSKKYGWFGVACDIGQMHVWLEIDTKQARGPFLMEAKFATSTPQIYQSAAGPRPPILIGLNFFADIQARLDVQSDQKPPGYLIIPPSP